MLVAADMWKKALPVDIDIVNTRVITIDCIATTISSINSSRLGKFFCRICHSDKQSFLPAYIINKWDFSNKHSVSNFASGYLNRIYTDASFNLNDLNPKLYEKNKQLKTIDDLRWILYYLRNYILPCRFAGEKG